MSEIENSQLEEIWSSARQILQRNNGYADIVMRLWFDEMKLTILTDDTAVFEIKSDFKQSIICKKYLRQVKEALSEAIGFDVIVTVRSTEEEKKTVDQMKAAVSVSNGGEEPKPVKTDDFYSDVGGTKILNRASVPAAYSDYTFDNFIVGSSNRFAHAAAMAVSDQPGGIKNNPLFIYGPSGLGKTHLLYAIIDRTLKNFPDYKIVYVKGEDFTNQLIDAIGKKLTAEFREHYRRVDMLLIDDIQFIAGKESTQEEFFNTFNELYENKKQIVLTSDRPAKDIDLLEERLRTRFESGQMADIDPPDMELRSAIIKQKAGIFGVELPDAVTSYIAENLKNNVRQLEGAVKRIGAEILMTGDEVTLDIAVRCIADKMVASETVTVTTDKILHTVSEKYDVTIEELKGRKRTSNIAFARHVAVYLIKKLTDRSFPAIGRVFGRDHSTIISSIEAVEKKIKTDPIFESEISEMIKTIKQG